MPGLTDLLTPGDVYEIRALNVREGGFVVRAMSGYFDDLDEMQRQAMLLESQGASGIYYTPNPVNPDCMARAANRVVRAKATTNDGEIVRRRWLLVDLDPVRPSGISSTDEELKLALQRARAIRDALDWPAPVLASSGNGAHLMWRIDLPNDEASAQLISGVLQAMQARFATPEVDVDQTVFNAARIWKVPGTTARKGDQHGGRVHRKAEILELGGGLVSRRMLEALLPADPTPEPSALPVERFDLQSWMREHHPHAEARPWPATGGTKWVFPVCPFNSAHTDRSAFVTQRPTGEIAAGCQHNSCTWDWHDLRGVEPSVCEVDFDALLEGSWTDQLIRRDEKILARLENAALFLERHEQVRGCFGYNEMLGRVVCLRKPRWPGDRAKGFVPGRPLEDHHETEILAWLERHASHSYSSQKVHAALERVARRTQSFHPVRSYLESLSWDGTPRVDALLWGYFGTPRSEYAEKIAGWWMISAVARAYEPGCQADSMIVLEGGQGAGKSRGLRALAGDWFSDTAIPWGTKEAYQQLEGVWIYEIAELDGMDFRSVETIKAFVTASTDRFRAAYGRNATARPRTCIFAGTTNRSNYLRDATGNRRFWPADTGYIDREAIKNDRDQLWAEAVTRYKRGERWWPHEPEEIEMCRAETAARLERDPWEAAVRQWLIANPRDFLETEDVLEHALDLAPSHQHPGHARRLADVMTTLGWKRGRRKRKGKKVRGFVRDDDNQSVPF